MINSTPSKNISYRSQSVANARPVQSITIPTSTVPKWPNAGSRRSRATSPTSPPGAKPHGRSAAVARSDSGKIFATSYEPLLMRTLRLGGTEFVPQSFAVADGYLVIALGEPRPPEVAGPAAAAMRTNIPLGSR